MKLKMLASAVLLTAITVSAQAGTEAKDMKDTKDMKEIAAPACPPDAGFYVAVYGGSDFSNSYGNKREVLSTGGGNTNIGPSHVHSNPGGAGGIKFGYNFQSINICEGFCLQPAAEGEAFYLGATSQSQLNFGTGPITEKFSYNSADFFANGIVRFKIDGSPVTPYVGVGVGIQYITIHGQQQFDGTSAKVTGLTGDDVDFAAQVLGGFDFELCPHWTLFTEYKFVDALGTNIGHTYTPGVYYRFKPDQIAQQVAVAGVKYNF